MQARKTSSNDGTILCTNSEYIAEPYFRIWDMAKEKISASLMRE
jgi:hypothetical protein